MAEFPRVAFVAGTLGRGGAERQLFYAVNLLQDVGADPVVYSLTAGEHWEGRIRALGIPVHWFGRSQNAGARAGRLTSLLRRDRPDLIQSAHFHTNLYAVAAGAALLRPVVGAIRNDTDWSVRSLGQLGRPSLHRPLHLAVNSLAAVDQAVARGVPAHRLTYLPNVVELERFHPDEPPDDRLRIVTVGRYVEQKRHDRFIRLVRAVKDRLPQTEISAHVVGEGPLEGELRAQAATAGLADSVEFYSSTFMPSVYASATVLVLTSDFEGTPNVILEAMAMGLPSVAFGVGGVPEVIVNSDVGVVVRPYDERAMADAVVDLLQNPARRQAMSAAASEYTARHRATEELPRFLTALYRRVAATQHAGARLRAPEPRAATTG